MQNQVIESGVQLFSRINHCTSPFCLNDINPKLFDNGHPQPNEIIEVIGDFTNDLLLDFLVRSVLPKELNENWKNSGVVFINTTHQISILKITNVIDAQLKQLNVKNRKPLIEKALSYVTVLNCYNCEQIEMTFLNLEKMLHERDNINLLIVDDITSQFWMAKQNNHRLSFEQFSRQNFQILQKVVKNLNILLIFSRHQTTNLLKTVDLHIEYKIIGEKIDSSKNQFLVMDHLKKTTKTVPFSLETCITFL